MDPTDFPTEQLFLWIPVNVIRQSHRQIMNHWEHTIEIAALSIVTTQPSCFLEDQIWALLQGFGQGFVFRLRPSDSKPVLLSVLPCTLLIDIVFDVVVWEYGRRIHELGFTKSCIVSLSGHSLALPSGCATDTTFLFSCLYIFP